MNRKRTSQKYWYCTDCPKTGSIDRRRTKSDRCSLFRQPNFFTAWSEGMSLNDPEKNDVFLEWSGNGQNRRCLQHRFQNPSTNSNSTRLFGNAYWFRQHLHERQRQCAQSQQVGQQEQQQNQTKSVRSNIYLAGGYSEYYKRTCKQRNGNSAEYQTTSENSLLVDKSFLTNTVHSEIINQIPTSRSSNKSSLRDLLNHEESPTCLTESSKSIKSPIQSHIWRKERSLSPDCLSPKAQLLHLSNSSLKPRYSLSASESSNKSCKLKLKSSVIHNQDEEISSRESSGSYAPRIADSTETTNGPLSLESRTSPSLLSVRSDEQMLQKRLSPPISPTEDWMNDCKTVTIPIITAPWSDADNHFEPNYLSKSTQSIFTASLSKSPKNESTSNTVHTKTRRPPLCLFSAHRHNHHHRDPVLVEACLLSQSGQITDRSSNLAGISASQLNSVNCVPASGSARLCLMPNIYATEAKSCTNLEETHANRNALFQIPSTGSTLSPLPRGDLPDVYLNPPSMSSLQSQRSSPFVRSTCGLSDMSDDGHTYSECIIETIGLIPTHVNGSNLCDKSRRHSTNQSCSIDSGQWTKFEELISSNDGNLDFERRDSDPFMKPIHSYNRSLFTMTAQSPSTLAPPTFDLFTGTDTQLSSIPVREKDTNGRLQHHLRRALSLTNRRRGPRSLSAEIQSIMNKHYEMTGIRLTTGTSAGIQQPSLKSALNNFGSMQINFKSSQSRIWKRRCSWTVGKDAGTEIQSHLKGMGSALHLDCVNLDLLNRFRHHKEKKSILASLTTTALPCLVPLRSRLHSDSCSNGHSSIKDGTLDPDFEDGRQATGIRRSSSCISKRNSLATLEKSLPLLGIHGSVRNVRSNVNLSEIAS